MKSEARKNAGKKYPYLGIFDDGTIVMFFAEGEGVCVHAGEGDSPLGKYSKYWLENDCEYYDGEVTLSND